jgi:hypothetical protein
MISERIKFRGGVANGLSIATLTIAGRFYNVRGHLYERTTEKDGDATIFVASEGSSGKMAGTLPAPPDRAS